LKLIKLTNECIMTEQSDINNLETELQIFLKIIEVRGNEINDKMVKYKKELDGQLITLANENILLQTIPTKLASELKDIIPKIAAELDIINTEKLNLINDCYAVNLQQQTQAIERAESKVKQLVQDLDIMDKKRITRFFLGVSVSVIVSVFASVAAASYMMQTFPTRVVINKPENIILNDSDVSLWGTDNVKVLKNVQKKSKKY